MDPNQAPAPLTPPPVDAPVMPGSENPGKTLGIVSLVTSLVGLGPVGIITGAIGISKSKKGGQPNPLAIAGLVVGIVSTILGTLFIVAIVSASFHLYGKCQELGTGTHVVEGVTYDCSGIVQQ